MEDVYYQASNPNAGLAGSAAEKVLFSRQPIERGKEQISNRCLKVKGLGVFVG